ncbi:MAG: hypothetical protein M1830_000458 [Pleopsidium flavum]|nr:MAG: hypothetical protein M1830_000458 [Pleopsidium flavum]
MAPPRPSRGPTTLPPYEPPLNPLTPASQRALQVLPQTHKLDRLKRHLDVANNSLTEMAGEVNDRYWQRADYHRRRKVRRAQQGVEDGVEEEERDRELEQMRERVGGMTDKMEEGVRRIIDAKAAVDGVENALVEVAGNVARGNGAVAATQSTLGASQFRQGRRRRGGGQDDDEGSDFEDEPSQEDGQENVGPTQALQKKLEDQNLRYDRLPLRNRYATNNDYIGFKRIIHDALHPGDDAPPLPNASTWFPSSSPSLPSTRTRGAHVNNPNASDDNDEDDDLAIASERISIKCPLTLLPYKDPVSSTKCPHNFEKAAILDMIARSAARVGGSNRRGVDDGEKAVQCPVCEVMLTTSDLTPNPVLLRKVKRIQAAERAQEDHPDHSSSDDDTDNLPRGGTQRRQQHEEIDDESGEDVDKGKRARSLAPRVKAEKLASSVRERESSVVVPSTQRAGGGGGGEVVGAESVTGSGAVVVDLGEGEDEEDDVDEEYGYEEEV